MKRLLVVNRIDDILFLKLLKIKEPVYSVFFEIVHLGLSPTPLPQIGNCSAIVAVFCSLLCDARTWSFMAFGRSSRTMILLIAPHVVYYNEKKCYQEIGGFSRNDLGESAMYLSRYNPAKSNYMRESAWGTYLEPMDIRERSIPPECPKMPLKMPY